MNTDKPILILLEEFISERDIRPTSIITYRTTIKLFINWMVQNNCDVRNPTIANILTYKNYLISSGKTALTIDGYTRILSIFFKWLEIMGYHSNITLHTHACKKYYGHRKGYLSVEQVSKLLNNICTDSILQKRNYAIVNLMVRTGLRCIEISRLNVGDLYSVQSGCYLDLQRKGSTERNAKFGISIKTLLPIEQYLLERDSYSDQDPLFINHSHHYKYNRLPSSEISRIITQELIRQGLKSKEITPHSLRHTAAINAYKANVPIYDISLMLGHKSIQTTQIYISAVNNETLKINPAVIALDDIY